MLKLEVTLLVVNVLLVIRVTMMLEIKVSTVCCLHPVPISCVGVSSVYMKLAENRECDCAKIAGIVT